MAELGLSGSERSKGGRFWFDRDLFAYDSPVVAAGSATCSVLLLTSSSWFEGGAVLFSVPLPAVERWSDPALTDILEGPDFLWSSLPWIANYSSDSVGLSSTNFRIASTSIPSHSRVIFSLIKAAAILKLSLYNITKRPKFILLVTIVRGAKTGITERTKSFLLSGRWVRRSGAGCFWVYRLMRYTLWLWTGV